MKNTIGIVGGMGPLATCDLFKKIIEVTDAATDQDHMRICIDSNTEIPDRTAAILNGGKDPVNEMVKSAVRLQGMGADVLIMPCNTAHYFYDRIIPFVDIPFLNMIEETAKAVKKRGIKKAGLMATDGTCQAGVYDQVFTPMEIELVKPSPKGQQAIMDVIYNGIKAGNMDIDLTGFHSAIDELFAAGAEVLILGCTELPVAFEQFSIEEPSIDPTLVLASAAVKAAGGKVKEEYDY